MFPSHSLKFDQYNNVYKFNGIPVEITENDTSYIFKSIQNNEMIYFIDHSQLLYRISEEDVMRIAIMSLGKQTVPTTLLMPKDIDTFVHTNVKTNFTSLRQLYAWAKFIIGKVNTCSNTTPGVTKPEGEFKPFNQLQIEQIFEHLNVNEVSEENKKCFSDSVNLFDFKSNVKKIFWFSEVLDKYGMVIPTLETLHTVHPREVFMLVNNLMRYVCVWEAADKPIDCVIASNIIFIQFLQDTGSSTNHYSAILPCMCALAVASTSPTKECQISRDLNTKAKMLFNRAKFNRDDNYGWYKFQMKVKNAKSICSREDCLDILQYLFFQFNIFKDHEFDVVLAYMRKVFSFYKKPELYIYIIVFGMSLLSLRVAKPIKNITGTKNLANFNIENIGVRNITTELKQSLYREMKKDVSVIFDFLDPYKSYMLSLQEKNLSFKINNLTDEVLFYFMKTDKFFSELINYILKTVLPLITSQLI